MKPIVVPVNFTACAENAANYAADMAQTIQADLYLVYALEVPAGPPNPLSPFSTEEVRKNGEWMLHVLSEDLTIRTKGQVSITTSLEVGDVETVIEKVCARIQPFLVIMGASGDEKESFLGRSNTVTAVHHLPYPLLVVPDKIKFQAIRTITLACQVQDVKEGIPVSISFLQELKTYFGARFEVIHFITAPGCHSKAVIDLHRWEQALGLPTPDLHFIEADNVKEGVDDYLATHNVDWLMIFPKKHLLPAFHKSQSKRIVLDCPIPVLSIYEHAWERNKEKPII